MKLYVENLPKVEHFAPVTCSSYNKLVEYVNTRPCMFITAFRSSNSKTVNRQLNKQLTQDIHNSDLTYIKCQGHWVENKGTQDETDAVEDTFCVVDNGYTNDDFIKLAVAWCRKYGQEAVLVTVPSKSRFDTHAIKVIGKLYNSEGNVIGRFNRTKMTLSDVDNCFTTAFGKTFALYDSVEVNATSMVPYQTMNGFIIASSVFKHKYPDLV